MTLVMMIHDSTINIVVVIIIIIDTHTHPFNGPFSGSTRVSQYQKGKTNLDFTEARDSEWQWHQLGHMQVCPTNSIRALKAATIIINIIIIIIIDSTAKKFF